MVDVLLFTNQPSSRFKVGFARYAGAYRMATYLRQEGYSCKVVDLFPSYTFDELYRIVDRYVSLQTKVVGFSSTFMARYGEHVLGRPKDEVLTLIEYIRTKYQAKVVLGGSNIPNVLREYPRVFDTCVYGQGERTLLNLLAGVPMPLKANFFPEKVYETDYSEFSSSYIEYESGDGVEQGEALTVEVARGCIFKCAYCGFFLNGKRFGDYTKSLDTLRAELLTLNERYGTTEFIFADDTINDSDQKVDMLYELSQSLPFRITWHAYARLDAMWKNRDMAKKLALSGARSLTFGIETFDEKAGKVIGKGLGRERTIETLHALRDIFGPKAKFTSGFILGLPHESIDSMHQTYEWLARPDCPLNSANFLALSLTPGFPSIFSGDPVKYGFDLKSDASWTSPITNSVDMKALAAKWTESIFSRHYFVTPGSFAQLSNIGVSREFQDTQLCGPGWTQHLPFLQRLTEVRESKYRQLILR